MTTKVCIVTPDIIGPIKNGGIGTHCYWLARFLAEQGHDVTVLFTSTCEFMEFDYHREEFKKIGITFVALLEMSDTNIFEREGYWFHSRSIKIFNYLKCHSYDYIHFQEWQANGFTCIRAKKCGMGFGGTVITVTMHSPSEWAREGMLIWPQNPIAEVQLDYAERYCCEHADELISPTQYMLDWAKRNGWRLALKQRVIQNLYKPSLEKKTGTRDIDYSHLIFFGRLETRKGLELFCQAVTNLLETPDYDRSIQKITFLGKHDRVKGGISSLDYLTEVSSRWSLALRVEILSSCDSFQALSFLKSSGGIAIIPSLSDNHPYTVVECLQNNIPFLASMVGGIHELVGETSLFAPRFQDLVLAIKNRKKILSRIECRYDPDKAKVGWGDVHESIEAEAEAGVPSLGRTSNPVKASICVSYFNHAAYLPQLLESIKQNKYENLEVIVVNDGSTDPRANQVFEDLQNRYVSPLWRFFKKDNEGLGATRNFGAHHASGKYIIFMDSDNIAKPNMVAEFVKAIEYSKVDCLTCFFEAFAGDNPPEKDFIPIYAYSPLGPCLELGSLINTFGDSNFCIKKEVFDAVGGFTTDPTTGYEDWEFLVNLTRKGYSQDVLPLTLFLYRHSEISMLRTTSAVANKRRVLQSYCEELDLYLRRMIYTLEVPLGEIFLQLEREGSLDNLFVDKSNAVRLEKEVCERNDHIKSLDQLIESQASIIRQLQHENYDRNQHIFALDQRIDSQASIIRQLQHENHERNQHIFALDSHIQELGEHIRRMEREHHERNQHIRTLDAHIDELSTYITQLERETSRT